jgi:succinate-acetate transporter protein
MSSRLYSKIQSVRQWIGALSAVRRLVVLVGAGGVFFVTLGIATAEEQDAVVALVASSLSLVSALVALYSVYALLRPFVSSGLPGDTGDG